MVKGQEKFGEFSSIAYECEQCYALKRGTKIYNCTRGGKLEVFLHKIILHLIIFLTFSPILSLSPPQLAITSIP